MRRRLKLTEKSVARLESAKAQAERELQEYLQTYWRDLLSEIIYWIKSKPSDILSGFIVYAQKIFVAEATEYIDLISDGTKYLVFLEHQLIPKVLREIVPKSSAVISEDNKVTVIRMDESVSQLRTRANSSDETVLIDKLIYGLWETLIDRTWALIKLDAYRAATMKGWNKHPFEFALRDAHNRQDFVERTEAALKSQFPRLRNSYWERKSNQTNQAVSNSVQIEAQSKKRKHGPAADLENHLNVLRIVESYGDEWKTSSNLEGICERFDKEGIPVPKSRDKQSLRSRKWIDIYDVKREKVIKDIAYRLKVARRN